jgi:Restriction endonuclease
MNSVEDGVMASPIVFYSRCKPQEVDAIEIVLAEKRVFIGYPMARAGATYDRRNLKKCVVDLSCGEDEWNAAHAASTKARQFNQNRNLALVPRPTQGVIYCGRVISQFELVNAPPWYDRYMSIRGGEDDETRWHAADVAQCWAIDQFLPIPVPRFPAWIRRSLFGRSTYGVIHPDAIAGDPYDAISAIIQNDRFEARTWTLDHIAIEKRLLNDLTPSTFEHLIVSLLQLEHPSEMWTQVGGSGDGGVDGVGASQDGHVTGLLQCKWQYWGENPFPADPGWRVGSQPFQKYLASLRYPNGAVPPNCIFLNRPRIAELVAKHHSKLPQALSMRIGSGPNAPCP